MSDQLVAEAATYNTQQTWEKNIHDFGQIRTTNPAIKRPQTYALGGTTIAI